jgi:exopolyphosphatase/guanosine-5'-triphosphate,3'-diphosphate pyrophosphatase
MRLASIDIGTNTILMLIADIDDNGIISIVRDEHVIARLGKGVDAKGFIKQETFIRVNDILRQFKGIANSHGVQHLVACGTSAFRDARNSQEFINFIEEQLSIEIRVLSGTEEAKLTYLGAISEYLLDAASGEYAVLDIGGGSTELVIGAGTKITTAVSIDIGCVRLTERILKNSPPDSIEIDNAIKLVQENLQFLPGISPTTTLIGVAGTLTTLASLDLRLAEFDRNLINRHILHLDDIERIFKELMPLTIDQIKKQPQIHPERADILLAGIIILREVLKKLNLSHITVSDRGLRYGLLINSANDFLSNLLYC